MYIFMDQLSKSKRINYLLHQMGIFSYYDVINHLPRSYENLNYTKERNLLDKDRVVLLGKITDRPKLVRSTRVKLITFSFLTKNGTYFKVVAFNRDYLLKNLNNEEEYTLVGVFNRHDNEINLINIYKGEIPQEKRIKPIYSLPKDYQQYLFANLVKKSFEETEGKIFSLVPYEYINKYRLVNKEIALKNAHFPLNYEQIHQSYRHLKYEEALLFSLQNQLIREENRSLKKIKKEPIDLSSCEDFINQLPYSLSEDQKVAASEIIEDMNQSSLMYRLLQGDVGTGKTLVCFIALYANYVRGDVGALMAPTDALARQHYENAKKLFAGTEVKISLLLGATPAKEKKEIYRELEEGYIDILIGTHALFTKSVNYPSLGLVVIDEQHRFGVNQRLALMGKGDHTDLLMMSATPIPRSLALTIYGDLDISTLYTFPTKKRDVTTLIKDSEDEFIYKTIDSALENGKQVYIIAPLIDFREDERYSVDKLYVRYVLRYGKKVGLLHGRLKSEEKEKALSDFYNGVTPILVSTQVIEVGIDVKKATVMVIYDASNFGLASLHQLRGRIGRDGSKATCILTNDKDDEDGINRLNVLVNSDDGFKIAEEDMKNRGPGELTGLKQSGIPDFYFLNIVDDYKIFVVARDDAKHIIENRNDKKYQYIIKRAEYLNSNNQNVKG